MAIRRQVEKKQQSFPRRLTFETLTAREVLADLSVGPVGMFPTIQAAVQNAAPGDRILIAATPANSAGFAERVDLSLMGLARAGGVQTGNLTIIGDDSAGGTTVVSPATGGSTFFNSQPFTGDLRFERLTLQPAIATSGEDIGINLDNITGNITIDDVEFYDAADAAIDISNSGGAGGTQATLTIDGVEISQLAGAAATPVGIRLTNIRMVGYVNDIRINDISDVGISISTSGTTQTSVTFASFFIVSASEGIVGNDGLRIVAADSSSLNVNVSEGSFTDLPGRSIDAIVSGTAKLAANIYGLTSFTNNDEVVRQPAVNTPGVSEPAVKFLAQGSALLSLAIDNNIFSSIAADAIQVQALDTSVVNARIHKNGMTDIGVTTGNVTRAIRVFGNTTSNATVNALISENEIYDSLSTAIGVIGNGSSTYNVRFVSNAIHFDAFFNGSAEGIEVTGVILQQPPQPAKLNLAFFGNTIDSAISTSFIGLRIVQASPQVTVRVEFEGGLEAFLETNNTLNAVISRASSSEESLRVPLNTFLAKAPQAIGDLVWNDVNRSGNQEAGESGVAGAQLTLTGTATGGPAVTQQVVADSQGVYMFGALLPGTYSVALKRDGGQVPLVAAGIVVPPGTSKLNIDIPINGTPWRNYATREDVDGNGIVTPLDALLIIINLNASGARTLPAPTPGSAPPPPYIDVNGDGVLAPLDALLIIIRLNAGANGEGEAESPALLSAAPASAPVSTRGSTVATSDNYLPPEFFAPQGKEDSESEDEDEASALDAFFATVGK